MRALALLCALVLTAAPAWATWSVVVVNLKTREVCSATATCVEGTTLDQIVPIVVTGKGAGAAQAFVHSSAQNRKLMFQGFKAGLTPQAILDQIEQADTTTYRQFGIVSFDGPPVTFSGSGLAGASFQYVGGVVGQAGDLWYAIQGNALTGQPVVGLAEQALLNTPGTLADKVVAAMVAAGDMGGDGRCSCGPDADGCGAPPPSFTKSAHQAVVVLARPGDEDGVCNGNLGCVNGDYYLFLHEPGFAADPDPVLRLAQSYASWRAGQVGMADHYESRVQADRFVLPADGESYARVRVRLVDLDGTPLAVGGDELTFRRLRGGQLRVRPKDVVDNGDGSYEFKLAATLKTGRDHWAVVVERPGQRPVQLFETVVVETVTPTELLASHYGWSPTEVGTLRLDLDRGVGDAGRGYFLAGTDEGTVPGFDLPGGVHVPINRGPLTSWLLQPGPGRSGFIGVLDAQGRAGAEFSPPPDLAAALVGSKLHFAGVLLGPPYDVTDPVLVEVLP